MSVRPLNAEASHALRIAGCEGGLGCLEYEYRTDEKCCRPTAHPPSKMDDPYSQKREEELFTINY